MSFTIAVMPDAQYMDEGTSEFAAETAWVASQKTALNIQFAVQLGDIVDHGAQYPADWTTAATGMQNIANMGIPFADVQGNHDLDNWYTHPATIDPSTWQESGHTSYQATFGPSTSFYSGKSWYGSMTASNGPYDSGGTDSWEKFTADGQTFLNICLEDEPSDAALTWATGIINANPGIPVILSTHEGVTPTGSFVGLDYKTRTSPYEPDVPSPANGAASVWNWVAQHDDRIFMWICGHASGSVDSNGWATADNNQTLTGTHGNPVFVQLTDYQSDKAGPNGKFQFMGGAEWVRTMTFDLTARTITEHTYSPGWNAYSYQLPTMYPSVPGTATPFDEPVSDSDFVLSFANFPQIPMQAATPTVSVTSSGSPAEAGPVTGTYTLTRTGSTTNSLTVDISMSGTAVNGTNYNTIANTVTFGAGNATATVTLTPINDHVVDPSDTATMTITAGSGYSIGSPASASLSILDAGGSSSLSVYEGFNYAVGSGSNLAGHDTGTGLGGNWTVSNTSTVNVLSGSLTYSAGGNTLSTSVNRVQATGYGTATGTINQSIGSIGSTVWVGFEFSTYTSNTSNALGGDMDLNPSAGASSGLQLGVPFAGNVDGRVTVGGYDGFINTTVTAVANQTYFIVASIQYLSTGDIINLYVNPTPGVTPSSATATKTLPATVTLPVTSSFILNGPQTAVPTFDEIRMGTSYLSVAPAGTGAVPNAPTGLSVAPSGSTLALTWTDNSTNETGFHVYRSTDDINFTDVHNTASNTTSWTDTVSNGSTYYYYVTAYNAAGESTASNTASNSGSGLIAYDGFNYTVGSGTWDGQAGGSGFTDPWTVQSTSEGSILSGNLNVNGLTESGNSAQLVTSSTATRAVNTTFGTDGTSLWVAFAMNQDLNGQSGALDSSVWIGSDPNNHIELGSPWNGFYDGQAYINGSRKYWNGAGVAPTDGSTVFLVYRLDFGVQANSTPDKILLWVNPTPGTQPSDASATTTWTLPSGTYFNFTDSNIVLNQASYWNDTTFDEIRLGKSYNDVAPVSGAPTPPNAPTNLAGNPGTSNIVLTWTDNSTNETGFHVYRSTDNSTWGTAISSPGANVTSYTDTTASAGVGYYYKVTSYNTAGESTTAADLTNTVATVIAYEGFNYTVGGSSNIAGHNTGVGMGANWTVSNTSNVNVLSGSMDYSPGGHSLVTSGNSVQVSNYAYATGTLSSSIGTAGTTVWVGFDFSTYVTNTTQTLSGDIDLNNSAGVGTGLRLGAPFSGDINGRVTVGSYDGFINTTVTAVANTTYFIVAKIQYLTTGDIITLYVDPTPGVTPTTASGTKTLPASVTLPVSSSVLLYSVQTNYDTFDELRIGASYAAVAPDPLAEGTASVVATPASQGAVYAPSSNVSLPLTAGAGRQILLSNAVLASLPVGAASIDLSAPVATAYSTYDVTPSDQASSSTDNMIDLLPDWFQHGQVS